MSNTKIGILCSWYTEVKDEVPKRFVISHETIPHTHISMKMYLCTLPNAGCLSDTSTSTMNAICQVNEDNLKLTTSKEFTLNSSTLLTIQNIFQDSQR